MPYTYQEIDFAREDATEDGIYRQIEYIVTIKRKPSYYIWVIMVPTFIISALNIAGIFMPHNNSGEREEKVTYFIYLLSFSSREPLNSYDWIIVAHL
jgi:hypothetical protein